MYIHRQLESQIEPFLKRKEAISIVGPRQAGKTTFIKYLQTKLEGQGKKVKFITFEKIADLLMFKESIEDFKKLNEQYQCVIIDEFQYAKDGGKKLKYLYDTSRTKYIISGSSSLELTFQTGKYMVGRLLEFRLNPFSFREFLLYKNPDLHALLDQKKFSNILKFSVKNGFGDQVNSQLANLLEEYAVYGGYPAVTLSKTGVEKEKVLQGIMEKYLLRDVKGLLNLATEDELLKLGKFLALQIGNIVKYEELARVSGLSHKELLKHLNILEKTFMIKLVKPFFTNKRLELTKNPKDYFIDLGMRNSLVSDFRPVGSRNESGAVMENYAFNLLSNSGLSADIKYWRTKSKAEVDFVIEREQKVYPIEVKYISRSVIGKSFHSFIDKFRPNIGIILTKDFLGEEKIKGCLIKFIPLSYF